MSFDPQKYLILQQGKPYLPAEPRVIWFRSEHKDGGISTEIIPLDRGALVKAYVYHEDGRLLGTGHKFAPTTDNKTVEKAETGAVGRALKMAGYGTPLDAVLPPTNQRPAHNPTSTQRARQDLGQGDNRRVPPTQPTQESLPIYSPMPEHKHVRQIANIYFQRGKGQKADGSTKFEYVLRGLDKSLIGTLYEGRLLREAGLPIDDWQKEGTGKSHEITGLLVAETAINEHGQSQIVRVFVPEPERG